MITKQYETFYEQQKQAHKRVKPTQVRSEAQLAFNYKNLTRHFRRFDNAERKQKFKDKLDHYRQARQILDQIADNPRLTQHQFEPLLDSSVGSKEVQRLWHSGSLYRLKKFSYPYFKEFQSLVRYVRQHQDDPPALLFDHSKAMVKAIEGAAVNYVAEIMMTYNHVNFANLNRNPITVLKQEGGVTLKAHSSSSNGNDYEDYTELVKEISSRLGLRNMLEADSYFNEIYWQLD